MTKYEKGYYKGKLAKILKLQANLPTAVEDPQGFRGYCDGYMNRQQRLEKPVEMMKNLFLTLVFS